MEALSYPHPLDKRWIVMFTNGIERYKRVIVYSVGAALMKWITAIIIGYEIKKAKSCYCNAAYAEDTRRE